MKKIIILLPLFLFVACITPRQQAIQMQKQNFNQCIEYARNGAARDFQLCHDSVQLISPYEYIKCQNDAEDRLDRKSQKCLENYRRSLYLIH